MTSRGSSQAFRVFHLGIPGVCIQGGVTRSGSLSLHSRSCVLGFFPLTTESLLQSGKCPEAASLSACSLCSPWTRVRPLRPSWNPFSLPGVVAGGWGVALALEDGVDPQSLCRIGIKEALVLFKVRAPDGTR